MNELCQIKWMTPLGEAVLENRKGLHSFDNYLDDEDVYIALENYWMDMFFMLLDKADIPRGDWISPYFKTTFRNGKKMMDGNPVFSARSEKKDKVIKVVQESPVNGDVFSYWSNSNENELVIVCTFNEHNLKKVKEIISSWI